MLNYGDTLLMTAVRRGYGCAFRLDQLRSCPARWPLRRSGSLGGNTRATRVLVAKPAAKSHDAAMDDAAFDTALIAAAFQLAAEQGWRRVSVVAAARAAGLPLARARERFPGRAAILLRFGRLCRSGGPDRGAVGRAGARPAVRPADAADRRAAGAPRRRAGAAARLARRPCRPRCCWRWRRVAACAGCSRRPASRRAAFMANCG